MAVTTTPPPPATAEDRLPGDFNMWVFVLGDLVFFGAYFVIFMVYRHREQALFLQAQTHLSLATGAVNTLVLLASSRFVASGVQSTRSGQYKRATRQIFWGGLCGVAFIVIKGFEWAHEVSQGFTLPHNDFFMFYYLLTGVHLVHVVLGLAILALAVRELQDSQCRVWLVESGATFWHMVDLLWIAIFALLYLMR
ncbi:MAG TPA: cytochrome c oxidase subunit 3 [Acidimicrobiales bacterium]